MRRFAFTLDNGTKLTIKPPTVRQYYKGLKTASNDVQLFRAIADICNQNDENVPITEEYVIDNFTVDDLHSFFKDFSVWVESVRSSDPN